MPSSGVHTISWSATPAATPGLLPVDLADAVILPGSGRGAKVVTDVVRDDFDGTCSYLLHCERSSGQYPFDVLVDAGVEFGIEIAGA